MITPRVALIHISQGDREKRESNTSVRCRKGITRETKAQEERKDWKREFEMRRERVKMGREVRRKKRERMRGSE